MFGGITDFFKGIKQTRQFKKKPCLYFTDDCMYNLTCVLDKDQQFGVPLGVNRKFEITKSYLLNERKPIYVIYDKHPQTVDFSKKPKRSVHKRAIETLLEKTDKKTGNKEILSTIKIEDYEVTGADELSSTAFKAAGSLLLKYMEEPSKREILLIAGLGLTIGAVIGIIISFVWLI